MNRRMKGGFWAPKEIFLLAGLLSSLAMLFSTAGNYLKVSKALHSFTVQVSEDCRIGRELEFTVAFTSATPLEIRLPYLRVVVFADGQYRGAKNYDWLMDPPAFSAAGGFTETVRIPLPARDPNGHPEVDHWRVELFGHFEIPGYVKDSFLKRHTFSKVEEGP